MIMNDEVIIIFWWRYDYDDAQTVPFLGPLSYTASLGKSFFCLFVFCLFMMLNVLLSFCFNIQARIAQLVAYRLGTGEIPGSNPSKGDNFSVKISNWIV